MPSDLTWQDGVPVSRRFDDPFYSRSSGLDEARHVFLEGNDLPKRLTNGFAVAELGFGTGLNLAALLTAAEGRKFAFTTFEAWPMAPQDMARALGTFGLREVMGPLLATLEAGATEHEDDRLIFRLIHGDARQTLPRWDGRADAWFLDGFSPAKNPQMWEPSLLTEVARHSRPGATAATFTAARTVREGLAAAGFEVTRMKGFARKRHMTRARLRS